MAPESRLASGIIFAYFLIDFVACQIIIWVIEVEAVRSHNFLHMLAFYGFQELFLWDSLIQPFFLTCLAQWCHTCTWYLRPLTVAQPDKPEKVSEV